MLISHLSESDGCKSGEPGGAADTSVADEVVCYINHQCCVSPKHKEADTHALSEHLTTGVKQSDHLKSSVLTSASKSPGMLQLHGGAKRTRHSDVPDDPQSLSERHSAEKHQLLRRRYHGIAAASSPAVSASSNVHNTQGLPSTDAPEASASSGKDSSLRGSSSLSSMVSDSPASGTSDSVTSATGKSAVSNTSTESDNTARDDASSTSVTSDNNALMVAPSASDSSPSPPPAMRSRLADAQPDKAAPANYSWAADALAAITQAGSVAQASAAKHASPTRQRGWSPAQDTSLQAPAPALQASAHDVSAMPNSPLKKRSRSSGRARASSARQSRSPSAHTRSHAGKGRSPAGKGRSPAGKGRSSAGKGRSSARLQSPETYSKRSRRLSKISKRRSKSCKGSSDRLCRSPARRHRSPTRQRRSAGKSPRGKFWQHKVWQERLQAQLQGPDMAAGEQRWGRLHHALQAQTHARAGGPLQDSLVVVLVLEPVLSVYIAGSQSCIMVLEFINHALEPYPVQVTV